MRRAALIPVLAMLASCSADPCDGQPGTCLWVDFQGDVGPLDTLQLALSGVLTAEQSFAMPPTTSRLPVALPVLLPDATGTVSGRGRGLRANEVLGEGEATVDVAPGAHVKMVIKLSATSVNPNPCENGVLDGAETDVDCGGACAGCADGKSCKIDGDCQSKHCVVAEGSVEGQCIPATCFDGQPNGTETDVDCGGMDCPARCDLGQGCQKPADCQSGQCAVDSFCF